MLPLEIFNGIFTKYVSTIGNMFGFNVMNPGYKITAATAMAMFVFSLCLISHVATLIFCDPPRNLLTVGESMATIQVRL